MRTKPSIPLAGLLGVCGVALIVFGSAQAKQFGEGFLGLAVAIAFVIPHASDAARRVAGSAPGVSAARVWRRVGDSAGRFARPLLAVAGIALLLCDALVGSGWPDVIRVFYGLLGALLIASACVPSETTSDASSRLLADRRLVRGLVILSAVAAVAAYLTMVVRLSTNVPYWDEFMANFRFVADYDSMSPGQRIDKLLRPHWGHRIVTTHLLTLAQRTVVGAMNFYGLALLANAFLLAAVCVIYASQRGASRRLALFAPFLLILLQPQYYALTLYGFSIANLGVLFFATLSFYLLDRGSRPGFWAAAACSIAATFTFGSGVLVGPLGLLLLLSRGRTREAAYWSILATLGTLLFFSETALDSGEVLARLGLSGASAGQKLHYVVALLGTGSLLGFLSDDAVVLANGGQSIGAALLLLRDVTGVLLLLGFGYIAARRYWERNATVFGLGAFVVLTAMSAAQTRTHAGDHDAISVFACRYAINSVLLAGLLYLALADLHARAARRLLPLVTSGAALFCAFSYYVALPHAAGLIADVKFPMLAFSTALYQGEPIWGVIGPEFDVDRLARSLEKDTYRMPGLELAQPFDSRVRSIDGGSLVEGALPLKLLSVGENATSYVFAVSASDTEVVPPGSLPGILLRGDGGANAVVELQALASLPGHPDVVRRNSPVGTTHLASVAKDLLPPGTLDVALIRFGEGGGVFAPTPYQMPTVERSSSLLRPLESPLVHEVYDHRGLVPQAESASFAPRGIVRTTDVGPPPYLVELVVSPIAPQRHEEVELCMLGLAGERSEPAIRLTYEDQKFVLSLRDRDVWKVAARLPAKLAQWTWVGISIDRKRVTLAACPVADPSLVRSVDTPLPAPLPGNGARVGSGRNVNGRQGVEIREMRISRTPQRAAS